MKNQLKALWFRELFRVLTVISSSLVIGYLSEQWLISLLIHSLLYLFWFFYQLWIFQHWFNNGVDIKNFPSSNIIGTLISEQFIQIHKTLKSRKKELDRIADHYDAIMSALPEATIILSKKFEIEWANKSSRKILAIDGVNDVGKSIQNIIESSKFTDFLIDDSQMDMDIQSPLNDHKIVSISKVKYFKDKMLLIARDVSQRIAIQKLRKTFISNASHELRTPLTVISGYLEILDDDEDLPCEINKVINNAHQQALRMEKILDDLLLLSKLEEKGFSAGRGKVTNIPLLLQKLISDFEASQSEQQHSFHTKIAPDLLLKVKEPEFISLCENLISNAIKYSLPDSEIKVCWRACNNGDACLSITDQGDGIPKKHLTRLTERFYRVNIERSRKVKGTGLGLSIVKHILDNYGGYLEIESELKVGSTFSAYFPASRVSSDSLIDAGNPNPE